MFLLCCKARVASGALTALRGRGMVSVWREAYYGPPGSWHTRTRALDWSRTHTWMEFNIRGNRMTPFQAQFAATHYDIIGIGGA